MGSDGFVWRPSTFTFGFGNATLESKPDGGKDQPVYPDARGFKVYQADMLPQEIGKEFKNVVELIKAAEAIK